MPTALRKLVFTSFLSLVFTHTLYADESYLQKNYVLDNPHWLLIPKSADFVNILSNELFSKTGYSLYVAVVDKIPESLTENEQNTSQTALSSNTKDDVQDLQKLKRKQYQSSLQEHLPKPYSVIFFMKDDKKMGILSSSPNTYFDEDKVYFEYMVPLLPKQKDDELTPQRISAIILNGYAQSADMIASYFDVTLEHNMPVDESGGREFVRFSMYVMLLVMFGIIGIIYITRKR